MPDKKIIAVIGATGAQGGGLVRAIPADRNGPFAARAITRKPDSDKARALAELGVEVVAADADDPASLENAFAGAHGAFCVTNFWEHFSVERERRAGRRDGARHAQVRRPARGLVDARGHAQVGAARRHAPADAAGQVQGAALRRQGRDGPRLRRRGRAHELPSRRVLLGELHPLRNGAAQGADGELTLALPLGGVKLPGIAADDIGQCAYGIFRRGTGAVGQRFGIAGDVLCGSGDGGENGARDGRKIGFRTSRSTSTAASASRAPRTSGTCSSSRRLRGDEFLRTRDPVLSRSLNPELLSFDAWLAANASRVPIG